MDQGMEGEVDDGRGYTWTRADGTTGADDPEDEGDLLVEGVDDLPIFASDANKELDEEVKVKGNLIDAGGVVAAPPHYPPLVEPLRPGPTLVPLTLSNPLTNLLSVSPTPARTLLFFFAKGRRERGEKGRGWVLPGGRSRYPRARRRVVAGCCRRCGGRWMEPMAHSSGRSRPRAHCPKRLGGPALLAACRHTRRRHARSASLWRPTAPSS